MFNTYRQRESTFQFSIQTLVKHLIFLCAQLFAASPNTIINHPCWVVIGIW